jgi:hypothetical protein
MYKFHKNIIKIQEMFINFQIQKIKSNQIFNQKIIKKYFSSTARLCMQVGPAHSHILLIINGQVRQNFCPFNCSFISLSPYIPM